MPKEIDIAIHAGILGAFHVENLFGRGMEELGATYKQMDGDTPCTTIDRRSGDAILSHLRRYFPSDTFVEEETGIYHGTESRIWYIDPFDGTSNAAIGLRLSTVGLAFQKGAELVAGVAIDPFNHKVYAAERGSGAYEIPYVVTSSERITLGDRKKIGVSNRTDPKARYAEVDGFFNSRTSEPKTKFLRDLHDFAQNVRMTGSNTRSGIHLASGGTDIWLIDAVGGFHDIAPGYMLIREAGGKMTDIRGCTPVPGVHVAIATNNAGDHDVICKLAEMHYSGYTGFR